jgi:ethanolamine utilization protein EutA (predicted chaperonin)
MCFVILSSNVIKILQYCIINNLSIQLDLICVFHVTVDRYK